MLALMLLGAALLFSFRGSELSPIYLGLGLTLLVSSLLKWRSVAGRGALIVAVLAITTVCTGYLRGWAAGTVACHSLLLIMAGLLFGRRALMVSLLSGLLLFTAGAYGVDRGAYHVSAELIDPRRFASWLWMGVGFGLVAACVIVVIRTVVAEAEAAQAHARSGLALAERLRVSAARAHEARLRLEREMREAQKLQSVSLLSGGLAHLFNNALTVVRSVVEHLPEGASLSERQAIATNTVPGAT